jgi:competence protein ComEC
MSVEVVFWDVQHGNASYIKSPNDRNIVIDIGTGSYANNDQIFSPLLHLKNRYDVAQLDYVIVTHPHLDHIDDILNFDYLSPKVFKRPTHLSKEDILAGVREEDRPKFDEYLEINNRYNQSLGENDPDDPCNPDNYGGLIIKNFVPVSCSTSNINNHSIITVISYAGIKVIFTGDNELCSINELMENEQFINTVKNADILLAPHHGRESGYHNDFISIVNPRLVIISDSRFCDTSAISRYNNKCRGWTVYKRDGSSEKRKCLTTRNDGVITLNFGNGSNNNPFLNVKIN